MELPDSYDALVAFADAAFADARARWPTSFACRATCTGCCHVHLYLLPIEAARVRDAIAGLSAEVVARIRDQARAMGTACPLLVDGRCSVYAQRPLVCRTQGMPLRFASGTEVCGLNFTDGRPPASAAIDADAINDQLVAIDFFARRRHAVPVSVVAVILGEEVEGRDGEANLSANPGEASA